jgi:hypothetical protein
MGNEIPWSQIHPTIKSDAPFVGVVIIDPDRKLCITEVVELDPEQLSTGEAAAPELIAATQAAAARLAGSYRTRRRQDNQWNGVRPVPPKGRPTTSLKVLNGGMF